MIRFATAGALALALVGTSGMFALAGQQAQPPAQHQHQMTADQAQHGDMAAMCQKMMAEHEAADARLTELAAAMTAASGDAKVTAMEQVLTELIAQRTAMHGSMMAMHGRMMGRMMSHMGGGMSSDMHESMQKMMAACPMMKAGGGDGGR